MGVKKGEGEDGDTETISQGGTGGGIALPVLSGTLEERDEPEEKPEGQDRKQEHEAVHPVLLRIPYRHLGCGQQKRRRGGGSSPPMFLHQGPHVGHCGDAEYGGRETQECLAVAPVPPEFDEEEK